MGPVSIDVEQLRGIAQTCQASAQKMTEEAANMKTQIANLHEALRGIPRLAVADHFNELNSIFSQMSDQLAQSDTYLRDVVNKVENFITSLA